jgi:hypothetical protein
VFIVLLPGIWVAGDVRGGVDGDGGYEERRGGDSLEPLISILLANLDVLIIRC